MQRKTNEGKTTPVNSVATALHLLEKFPWEPGIIE
jgi:hypothetical protein